MRTLLNSPVKVRLDIDSQTHQITLHCIKWEGKVYTVQELGIRYPVRTGRKVVHVFCVNVGTLDMRLEIDAETLHATLTEVSDGLAD